MLYYSISKHAILGGLGAERRAVPHPVVHGDGLGAGGVIYIYVCIYIYIYAYIYTHTY